MSNTAPQFPYDDTEATEQERYAAHCEMTITNLRIAVSQLSERQADMADELAAEHVRNATLNDELREERSTRLFLAREVKALQGYAERAKTGDALERQLAASVLIEAVVRLARCTGSMRSEGDIETWLKASGGER